MKRFLVFAGETYYPMGGWADFQKDYDTFEEASNSFTELMKTEDWMHIVDSLNGQVVKSIHLPCGKHCL